MDTDKIPREQPPKPVRSRRFRRFLCLDDFEVAARRRLPRILYNYISGGAETNSALLANAAGFARFALVTRVLRDITERSLDTMLLGQSFGAPVGIAPMGITALSAYEGDLALARAAFDRNIPVIMSGASLTRMEDVIKENPNTWFQAYLPGDENEILAMLSRIGAAGFRTLVITVDTPVIGKREDEIRAGFTSPIRPSFQLGWDGISHPRWLLNVFFRTLLKSGLPHFHNVSPDEPVPAISSKAVREFNARGRLTWRHIQFVRNRWPGNLIVKGILHKEDAKLARSHGVDGIIVSNHGGRQLDCAVSPLLALGDVVPECGDMTVMVDGGFRRGTDVIKALALGAKCVFLGRPFGYAAAIGGKEGVVHAISILQNELDLDIALLGLTRVSQIDKNCISPGPDPAQDTNGSGSVGETARRTSSSSWPEVIKDMGTRRPAP